MMLTNLHYILVKKVTNLTNRNVEKLNTKLRESSGSSLFYDSRADLRIFVRVINELHDKINNLIDENRSIRKELSELKSTLNK